MQRKKSKFTTLLKTQEKQINSKQLKNALKSVIEGEVGKLIQNSLVSKTKKRDEVEKIVLI